MISKIDITLRESYLKQLRNWISELTITGMTVSYVMRKAHVKLIAPEIADIISDDKYQLILVELIVDSGVVDELVHLLESLSRYPFPDTPELEYSVNNIQLLKRIRTGELNENAL